MMDPARTEHHPSPLCTLLVLTWALGAADAAHLESAEVQLYVGHGSDVLIPGTGTDLQGEGVLEWYVKKAGAQEPQWILSYHYGTNEAEMSAKYEHRVLFSMKNASLKLFNLTHQDDGRYILELNSVDGKDEKHVLVRVIEPISDIKVMKILSSGDSGVRLVCEASGDVWNLTWWNNGRELMQDITREGNTSELLIKEMGPGSYTCVAWNPISQLETSYQIAQQSIVILCVLGLLTVAVAFSLPCSFIQLFLCVCQKHSCQCTQQRVNVLQRAAFVCWFLFLVCALISAIVGWAASVSYAFSVLNLLSLVLLMSCLITEIFSLSYWKCMTQPYHLKKENRHRSQDFRAYEKPAHFELTVSLAAVGPTALFIPICWCCRPNGPMSRWLDRPGKKPVTKERTEDMEMGVLPGKVPVGSAIDSLIPMHSDTIGT